MARFEVYGRGKDSGRKRKRVYSAFDEQEVRRFAEADGTVIEEIKLLPPDPPTERQLEYAKDLAIDVPSDATKDDVSDLISVILDKDKPATPRHRAFARRYRIEVTNYIGKRALFDRILFALKEPGKEKELLSWFTYRVYRELVQGVDNAPIDGPDHPVIQEVATQLESDESIIKSIRRYEGRELIWFGEWTSPSGHLYTGGSNRTTAYKQASACLRERLNLPTLHKDETVRANKNTIESRQVETQNTVKEPKSCLSVFVLGLIIMLGLIFSFVWVGK